MAQRVLFSWELGSGLGHLGTVAGLIRQLLDEGTEVCVAAGDLSRVAGLLPAAVRIHQAPLWPRRTAGLPATAAGYAEILARCGYLSATGLAGLLRAWQSIMRSVRPHLLVAESSPTALLAARALGIPRVVLGHGFAIPPAAGPWPPLIPVDEPRRQRLRALEDGILQAINTALESVTDGACAGCPPGGIESLHEIFAAEATALCTFPELDHYPERCGAAYLGPLFGLPGLARACRRDAPAPHVFAYLKPELPGLGPLLRMLRGTGVRVLASIPGVSAGLAREFAQGPVRVTARPLDLDELSRRCDLALTHGGHGLAAQFLLSGVPQATLPLNLEQLITARNLARIGAGIVPAPGGGPEDVAGTIAAALTDERLQHAARTAAETRAGYEPRHTVAAIRDEIRGLL